MTSTRQRILTLAVAALLLGGIGGLSGAVSVSAQTAVAGPEFGFPYNVTYPVVGSYPQASFFPSMTFSPFTTVVSYTPTTALTTVSYNPSITNAITPTFVAGSTYFSTGTYISAPPLLSVQTNGQYCTDKTGGMTWVPSGASTDSLKCGS